MKNLNKALKLMQEKMREEYGEDIKLEDGDNIVGVFNDCVINLENQNNEIKVNVIVGEPYIIDMNVFEKGEII